MEKLHKVMQRQITGLKSENKSLREQLVKSKKEALDEKNNFST